jgi:2-polyprenyl-3-methyl-5-hydroxy-6-metoxy-1,4-benzoquinol methylase
MESSDYHDRIWEAVPRGARAPGLELRRRFLLERAAAVASGGGGAVRVLDVGCGEGHLTAALADAGCDALGVDVSQRALERARSSYPRLDLRVIPERGSWALPDAHFDLVWAGEVIEHVADTSEWLSEVRRVLRSGGVLALTTPANGRVSLLVLALSRRAFDERFDPRGDHLRFYSRRSLCTLLSDFGFEEIDVRVRGGALRGSQRVLLASARRSRFAGRR